MHGYGTQHTHVCGKGLTGQQPRFSGVWTVVLMHACGSYASMVYGLPYSCFVVVHNIHMYVAKIGELS